MDLKRIGIFGAGYVGNSLGILLSHHFKVTIFDINKEKIERINKKMLAYEIEEDQTIDAKYFSGDLDARIFSKNFKKYINLVSKSGGIILLITGILILTNQLQALGYYLLNVLPFLQNFG